MLLDELLQAFLHNRRNGLSGSKGAARPYTLRNYEWGITHFIRFMQERDKLRYRDIRKHDVRQFVEHVRMNPKWTSEATRYGILRAVRAMMNFIESDEECQDLKLESHTKLLGRIPKNPRRRFLPTVKDLKKLRALWDTRTVYGLRNYVIFNLILGSGLRSGEIRNLRLEDLHLDDKRIHVPREGKTGQRLVPIDDALVGMLRTWLRKRANVVGADKGPWVFIGRGGEQLGPTAVVQAFRKIQTGLTREHRTTLHTLRHAYGTLYLGNGGNMERLRLIMGHSSYDTLQGYLHLAQVGNKEAQAEVERVSPLKTVMQK